MSEVEKHKVAIVIFCEAEGVDELDASTVAERAIMFKLTDGKFRQAKLGITFGIEKKTTRDVTVVKAMDAGLAAGNGYLWTSPTSKAFREFGM